MLIIIITGNGVNRQDPFVAYRTSAYKLHFYETLSKLRFVLLTDPLAETLPMRETLKYIHEAIYVETVAKNTLVTGEGGVSNALFRTALNRYISGLPQFGATSERSI